MLLRTLGGFPARSEPVTFACECEDGTVMNEPIDDGGSSHLVRKDLRPFLEWKIGRERDAASFVTLRDELKEQISCFSFERNVSEFVDEQQIDTIVAAVVPLERCCFLRSDKFHEQRRSRRKEHAVTAHAHCKADGAQDMTLADTRRSAENNVAMRVDERPLKVFEQLGFGQVGLEREIK